MGQTGLLVKLDDENKDCKWIYRFRANPGRPWGGIVPPSPVLAPGRRSGAAPRCPILPPGLLSLPGALRPCKALLLGLGTPSGIGRRQFLLSCGPDRLGPAGQFVGRR